MAEALAIESTASAEEAEAALLAALDCELQALADIIIEAWIERADVRPEGP